VDFSLFKSLIFLVDSKDLVDSQLFIVKLNATDFLSQDFSFASVYEHFNAVGEVFFEFKIIILKYYFLARNLQLSYGRIYPRFHFVYNSKEYSKIRNFAKCLFF